MDNKDIEEATFKAGYAFASTSLDMNAAWLKFDEVNQQIKKNAMKHPITGEQFPKYIDDYPLDNDVIWEK